MRSTFIVYKAALRPMRAAACAASQPACPAPTITTSYFSSNIVTFPHRMSKRSGPRYRLSLLRRSTRPVLLKLDTDPTIPSHVESASAKPPFQCGFPRTLSVSPRIAVHSLESDHLPTLFFRATAVSEELRKACQDLLLFLRSNAHDPTRSVVLRPAPGEGRFY